MGETRLVELASAVLDGTPVDWGAVESGAGDTRLPFLEHLRIVAAVAEVHRSTAVPVAGADSTPLGSTTERWGHLRLLERIGRGSFGEVYRAWDTRLDREVALKLLPVDAPGKRATSSIIHEGRLLARVRHPNVVTIYDAERIEGRVGLWMEFVRGKTLEQLIDQGDIFSAAEAVEIGVELCGAVTAVHDAGLLHRDIKAANVMRAEDGRIVLMDFGTGWELADGSDAGLAGTPLYLAPELLSGGEPTVRSDIYSVGVLLYHLLTRSYPVPARSVSELRMAHERRETRSLRTARPDLAPKLAGVVDRAIDPQPARRYESAAAIAADLSALGSRTSAARWLVALAASGLIAVAVGLFLVRGGRFLSSGSDSQASRAAAGISAHAAAPSVAGTHKLTESGRALSAVISPDGRFVIYVVDQAGTASLWLRQLGADSSQQIVPPAEVRYWQPTISPDGQSLYFIRSKRDEPHPALYRMPVAGGAPARLIHEHADLQGGLALSPDGRRVALIQNSRTSDESVLLVVDANGGGERTLARRKYSDGYWHVAWSPDGRRLAAVVGNADSGGKNMNVVSLNLDDGTERAITTQPMAFVGNLEWLADGSGLLMVATDLLPRTDQIWHLSYPNGAAYRITDDASRYSDLSLSADSTALVTSQLRRRRTIWVAPGHDTGNPSTPDSVPFEAPRARQITSGYIRLCWTPGGQVVYTSMASGTANIWRASSDGTTPQQLTTTGLNTDPSVSPDGHFIVFTSNRGAGQHIWRMDIEGGNAKQMTNGDGEAKSRITPDGQSLVYNSTLDWTLWRMSLAGGEPMRLTQTFAREPALSPDGSLIAYNFRDTHASPQWKIAVIPANGGTPQRIFDRQRAEYQTFELNWTPDGRAVTYEATQGGVSNIWSQPLAGGRPRRLTNFTTDYIYGFAWAFDGKQLAVVRGAWDSDVLLLSLGR